MLGNAQLTVTPITLYNISMQVFRAREQMQKESFCVFRKQNSTMYLPSFAFSCRGDNRKSTIASFRLNHILNIQSTSVSKMSLILNVYCLIGDLIVLVLF